MIAVSVNETKTTEHGQGIRHVCAQSISHTLRWPNTVFTRALANAMQRARTHCIKINMASIQQSFYFLNASAIWTIFRHNWTLECFYDFSLCEKCMSEKVTMRRTPQFVDFSLLSNEPSQLQRMRSKLKKCDWMRNSFLGNTPVSREPHGRI